MMATVQHFSIISAMARLVVPTSFERVPAAITSHTASIRTRDTGCQNLNVQVSVNGRGVRTFVAADRIITPVNVVIELHRRDSTCTSRLAKQFVGSQSAATSIAVYIPKCQIWHWKVVQ
jgi:hypothetical protein